jgi:hypothetical protein
MPDHMTIDEIRVANLRRILADRWDGRSVNLARAIGAKQIVISRCLSGSASARNMGDRLARRIEIASGLEPGWMDSIHTHEKDDVFAAFMSLSVDAQEQVAAMIRLLRRQGDKAPR